MLKPCVRCNHKGVKDQPEYHGFYTDTPGRTHRTCSSCGAEEGRRVIKRLHPRIGGKRGRNSGKVSQHGKKQGR